MAGKALVLGGGGVTGIAWELGILAGLAEAGVNLSSADLVIGTSAGSVVGSLVASGTPVEDLYQRQLAPPTGERAATLGLGLILRYATAGIGRGAQQARARIGAMALAAKTVTEAERRAIIENRLVGRDWPTHPMLRVTAVAADDGEFATFDRDSGVSLVDAVAASCAVPGVWPPVTINGRRYIDGGIRSPANVDLAADCDHIVVLAPIRFSFRRHMRVAAQVAALPPTARAAVVAPDAQARKAIGRNVLDPQRRAPSARAGRAQAARVVETALRAWKD